MPGAPDFPPSPAPPDARFSLPRRNVSERGAEEDSLRHLYRQAPISALIGLGLGGVVALTLWDRVQQQLLLPWLGLLGAVTLLRLALYWRFGQRFRGTQLQRWESRYAIASGLTGIVWGSLAWLPSETVEQVVRQGLIFAGLLCVAATALATLATSARAYLAFVGTASFLLLARVSAEGLGLTAPVVLGSGLLFLIQLTGFAAHHRSLRDAFIQRRQAELLQQQQRVVFDSAGEGIVFLRPKPEYVVQCNQRFADLFGYRREALIGMPPWHWHPAREQWKKLVIDSSNTIASGAPFHSVLPLQRRDGTQFWAEITGMAVTPHHLSDGTVWVISDITEQRQAAMALRTSEQRFRDLVALSSDMYWEQDENFRFTSLGGAPYRGGVFDEKLILGRRRWEIEGIRGVSESRWQEHIAQLEAHQPFRDFIYQLKDTSGRLHWISISGNPILDSDGRFLGYHGTSRDITSGIENEERYRHLAYHDSLTGLPNRRLFEDRLGHALANADRYQQQFAVLLVDLDGFKQVNDQLGHACGDRVLEAVAERLRQGVRNNDTVARLGGDEFVVLVTDIQCIDDATTVADKLLEKVTQPIPLANRPTCQVGASIGISLYPRDGQDAATLLSRADLAMYAGKHQGGRQARVFA